MRMSNVVSRRAALFSSLAVVGLCLTTPKAGAFAQAADPGASAFLQSLGQRAISAFSAKSDMTAARAKFRTLLTEGFDIPYIGRWVLGRYWNVATDAQKAEYQRLFEKMIVETYAGRFADYSGETFKITGSRAESGTDTTVSSQIVRPNGPPLNVDWRVRKNDNAYKIIDVTVEGISMGITQRSEFASVIQTNGGKIDGLIASLKSKVGG